MRIIFLSCFLLSACTQWSPWTRVLSGNMSYNRGEYQKSLLHYFAAEDESRPGIDRVYYNLGNVYYSLGEGEAALRAWIMAEDITDDVELLFRIAFNRGLLYYNWGRYEEAYRSFRRALLIKPSDIDSKVNLENSLLRIRLEVPQPVLSEEEGSRDGSHVLEYLKRKEMKQWTSKNMESEEFPRDW